MPTSRITISADLVRTMQHEGAILLLLRHWGAAFLLSYAALAVVFVGGAALALRAGSHELAFPLAAAFVLIAFPIVAVRRIRRIVRGLLQPYDVGGGVESEIGPDRLRLRDPDTGFSMTYRTRGVRTRGSTALVEVAVSGRRGLILVPRALLVAERIEPLAHGS